MSEGNLSMTNQNDMKVLDSNRKTVIHFLGKDRELSKTTKRISNKITYLLKKESYMNSNMVDFKEYEKLSEEWIREAGKLVKQIVKPVKKEELEYIDVQDLEVIQDAIERRKYKARGYSDEDIDALEQAGKKAIIARARMLGNTEEDVDTEDFQMKNTD